MFSPDIVESDEFYAMPQTSQALYFHLGMNADDDGFVQPHKVMKLLGSPEDDLKVLLAKRFLLTFEGGVVVIKHWLIHNLIRSERHKPTRFQDEKKRLYIKENKAYTDKQQPNVRQLSDKVQTKRGEMSAQVRLGKVRLGKEKKETSGGSEAAVAKQPVKKITTATKKTFNPEGAQVLKAFADFIDPKNGTYYTNTTQRAACDFLIETYTLERVLHVIEKVLPMTNGKPLFPQITSALNLKEKWVNLEDAVKRHREEKGSKNNRQAFV